MAEWTKDQIIARIRGEATKQGVDPDLALAVATQESELWPNAKGDNGKSLGLFQLQPAAAIDVGVNPQFRHEPGVNIYGGVSYLKQKLTQAKGNVEQALRLYNGGGDPNYVQNVYRFFKPGVAHASERPQTGTYTDTDVQNALQALQGSTPPQTPAGGTYSDEDIQNALTVLGGAQQPAGATPPAAPVSQTTPAAQAPPRPQETPPMPNPAPTPADAQHATATLSAMRQRQAESATPESRLARFQQLPAITALSPEERQAAVAEFQGLQEAQQRAVLASEPAADLPTAMQEGPRPTPEQQLRPQMQPGKGEPPVTEGITKPSTMIPLLMPGAGLKLLPEALRYGTGILARGARPMTEGLSQTLAWGTGKTLETGKLPSVGEVAKEAAWNIGTSAVPEVVGAVRDAWGGLLRTTPGGQRLLNRQAVTEAEGLGQRVFEAEDKAAVSQMFDEVAASKVKLDVTPLQTYWQSLIPEERRLALRELNAISPAFAQGLGNPRLKGWDIGDLQHLRSELLKASHVKKTPAVQDLLMDMRSKVDDAIAAGKAVGSVPIGTNAETLQQAQAAWRKVQQAENLQSLVTKHTHRSGRDLRNVELNLSALDKDLRGGGTKAAQRLVGQMNQAEKDSLQAEMKTLSKKYPFMHISDTGAKIAEWGSLISAATNLAMGNVPASLASVAGFMITAAARSPRIMGLLSRSIVESQGRLTPVQVDTILNAIRHEQEGASGTPQ